MKSGSPEATPPAIVQLANVIHHVDSVHKLNGSSERFILLRQCYLRSRMLRTKLRTLKYLRCVGYKHAYVLMFSTTRKQSSMDAESTTPATSITALSSMDEVDLQARFRTELARIHVLHGFARRARYALSRLDAIKKDPNRFKTGLYTLQYLHGEVQRFPPWIEFDLTFAQGDTSSESTHGRIAGMAIKTWTMIQLGYLEAEATTTPPSWQKDSLTLQMNGYADNQRRYVEWTERVWRRVCEYFARNPFYLDWDMVPSQLGWELDIALVALQDRYLSRSCGVAIPNVELLILRNEQDAPHPAEADPPPQPILHALPAPASEGETEGKQSLDRDGRDGWIYAKCCERVVYKNIKRELNELAPSKGWLKISTIQGIRAAAKRFAERHNLPLPPSRHET